MEPQRKRIFRRMMLFVLIFTMLVVFRLTTLDGVSQSRSSFFLSQATVPVPSPVPLPLCNVLPAENLESEYVIVSTNVLSVNLQGSFVGTVPAGFVANGQTHVIIDAGKDILGSIKPGEYLQVALTPRSGYEFTVLEVTSIDQKTYTTCKPNAVYFRAQVKQTSDRQVVYWENGSQVFSFDPKQFPVSVDKPVQVIVQFNEKGNVVVLQAYNVS